MEEQQASKPLPIESFSYSWLVNFPSLESLFNSSRRLSVDTCDDDSSSSFIEMDPRLPPSKRFLIGSQESFKFDFPGNESLFHHADELFRDGYVVPLQGTEPSYMLSSNKLETRTAATKSKASRKYRRVSKRLLMKYLEFLTPLCGKQRKVESRIRGAAKNRVYSDDASPRLSEAFSADDWRRSCDSESSIYEAVLHCKKSFGKHTCNYNCKIMQQLN